MAISYCSRDLAFGRSGLLAGGRHGTDRSKTASLSHRVLGNQAAFFETREREPGYYEDRLRCNRRENCSHVCTAYSGHCRLAERDGEGEPCSSTVREGQFRSAVLDSISAE